MNQRLEKYILEQSWNKSQELLVTPGLPLFHYTSLASFQMIAQKQKLVLWATDIHYLNDKNEWKHARNVYQCICGELLETRKMDKYIYDAIINIRPNLETVFITSSQDTPNNPPIITGTVKNSAKFVVCFSTQQDSLPMWNYYSKRRDYCGCNFGAISNLLLNNPVCNPKTIHAKLYKVIYQCNEKKKIIEEAILGLVGRADYPDDLEEVRNQLAYKLAEWSFCFKDPHFEYEQEIRLCVDLPQEDYLHTVKYRDSHGMLIPYIELDISPDALLSVTIGPLTCEEDDKELQKEAVQKMLLTKEYSNKNVSFSRCPIRF